MRRRRCLTGGMVRNMMLLNQEWEYWNTNRPESHCLSLANINDYSLCTTYSIRV